MAMGTRKQREKQEDLWIAHTELAAAPGHPFYQRLNELLEAEGFDEFVEGRCARLCGGTRARVTRSFCAGWRRPRGSKRRRAKTWRGWTVSARNARRIRSGRARRTGTRGLRR